MIASLLLTVGGLVLSPIPPSFHPVHIEVSSAWRWFVTDISHPYGAVDIVCTRHDATWNCTGGWIEDSWVRKTLDAARIPDTPGEVRLAGYSDSTLARLAHKLRTEIRDTPYWSHAERSAGLSLATVAGVRKMIAQSFYPRITHSNGFVASVVVLMQDAHNNVVKLETQSTGPEMLPWSISYDGRTVGFAHTAISSAVASMLPPGESNRLELMREPPDPWNSLLANIDFRLIGCRYNENPNDTAFCALTRK